MAKHAFLSLLIFYSLSAATQAAANQTLGIAEMIVLSEREDHPEEIAFSPNGLYLASSITGGAKIWRLDNRESLHTLLHKKNTHIWSLCFSPDGKNLVTGCNDIKFWSVRTGKNVRTIWSETGAITAMAFNSDGTVLAAASGSDYTVTIYEVASGEAMGLLDGHSDLITYLAFSPDDTSIISTSCDKTAKIWDAKSARERRILSGHLDGLNSLFVDTVNNEIYTADDSKLIKAWSLETGDELEKKWLHNLKGYPVCLSPDGLYMAYMKDHEMMEIVRFGTGEMISRLKFGKFRRWPKKIVFSSDGLHIGASDDAGSIVLWRLVGVGPSPAFARLKEGRKDQDLNPPEIEMLFPLGKSGIPPVLRQKRVVIKGIVRDESGVFEVTVNGKEAHLREDGEFSAEIRLAFGENLISIKAEDTRENVSSKSLLLIREFESTKFKKEKRKGKDYALLFGCNYYEEWERLQKPLKDASAITQLLESTYGFDCELIENPELEVILRKLREYAEKGFEKEDQLLVFFAGHGHVDELFKESYIVARDSRVNDELKTSYMSLSTLKNAIDNIPCPHIFLVIDACFAGTGETKLKRGFSKIGDFYKSMSRDEFISRKLSYKSRISLSSGGKRYMSGKGPQTHSPFVDEIKKALCTKGGKDGILTLNEIMQFMEKVDPLPKIDEFGSNDPGSDFLFISR